MHVVNSIHSTPRRVYISGKLSDERDTELSKLEIKQLYSQFQSVDVGDVITISYSKGNIAGRINALSKLLRISQSTINIDGISKIILTRKH